MNQLTQEIQEVIKQEADKLVFETNGHKWSNNDSSAGDNFSSYQAGATKWALEAQSFSEWCYQNYYLTETGWHYHGDVFFEKPFTTSQLLTLFISK